MSLRFSSLMAVVGLSAVLGTTTGCNDDAYCFVNCDEGGAGGSGGEGGEGGSGGVFVTVGSGGDGGTGGGCQITNAGVEACDEIDNDCDGEVDEESDLNSILTCGTCDNSCFTQLLNADPTTIVCDWDGTPGNPGTCSFTECASDYFDVDGDGVDCEYYCVQTEADDSVCNNRDDDCDGVKDEDVDLCGDVDNCGTCGRKCVVAHGTGSCEDTGQLPCTPANTDCAIAACDDDDNDGSPDWWDVDGSYPNGCEYACSLNTATNGVEICGNGIDDDCDGAIDGADTDLSGDPVVGTQCFGDPDGLCATPAHAGMWECQGQQLVCAGANVLRENDLPELCNLDAAMMPQDDDCDGVANESPIDAGATCGMNNVFPCRFGTEECVNGALQCIGAVDPMTEVCDGIDNDCDGGIDTAMGNPPSDAGGACNVPIPPPAMATSPCMAGALTCTGGVLTCNGSVGPTSQNDGCGDDSNCDGQLTGQPDTNTDVSNCGGCNNDCFVGTLHKLFTCAGGVCQDGGCEAGWWDLDANPDTCEYGPCLQTGSEICDGIDNDCNGTVDDVASIPAPSQVCGVSTLATRPECTTQVSVVCNAQGTWECTFPAGVCGPDCASATEICDGLDNDCDGSFNENVAGFGLPCQSDDGLPFPGHGACQTSGTLVCDGPSGTQCSAVKEDCANLPDGCTEECDGVDNDCDGYVDEMYYEKSLPNGDATYFVMPAVTQVGANLWVMTYEASRPDAEATTAGDGNGYHCASGCGGLPSAPVGEPLDETVACSVPDRLPWFNVTPIEAEQTCDAIGGRVCTMAEWMTTCDTGTGCDWGYSPNNAACTTNATAAKFCNLAAFDFSPAQAGIQDGLLVGGSPLLASCSSDWSGTFTNDLSEPQIFDVTGNLREITKNGVGIYPLMGGAFNTQDENGATCDFDFFVVDDDFKLLDTGFRCCFDTDPTQ